MADNVTVDNGALADVEVASDRATYSGDADRNIQLIKPVLTTGAEGSKTVVEPSGDATNGWDVDVTRVIPGTGATNLGKVEDDAHANGDVGVLMLGVRNYAGAGTDGDNSAIAVDAAGSLRSVAHRDMARISVASAGLTIATTAYSAGDQVGTMFALTNAARASGGTGMIVGVSMVDIADIVGAYDVAFFRSNITLAADNAAFAISDADSLEFVGLIQLAGSFDIGNNRVQQAHSLAVPYDCAGGTTLYAALINRFGHTFFVATTNIQLIVHVERN